MTNNQKEDTMPDTTNATGFEDMVGEKIFVRTVTYHLVGEVEKVTGNLVHLVNASWVADSGKFGQMLIQGTIGESDYVGKCAFNANAVTDLFPWVNELPTRNV
jgi:hypothetical protein